MTIKELLLESNLVKNDTKIIIRKNIEDRKFIETKGNWYVDKILKYKEYNIDSFTWKKENKIYIDIDKEEIIYGQTCDLND